MNSRHLNIRGKLMCGFGPVLAIAALQSGLAALRLRAVNEQSSFIVHNALPSVRVLGQLEADRGASTSPPAASATSSA